MDILHFLLRLRPFLAGILLLSFFIVSNSFVALPAYPSEAKYRYRRSVLFSETIEAGHRERQAKQPTSKQFKAPKSRFEAPKGRFEAPKSRFKATESRFSATDKSRTPKVRTSDAPQNSNATKQNKRRGIARFPRPDITAQLAYARDGHTVLRQHLRKENANIPELRRILYQHGQVQQLKAWQQKVQVAAGDDATIFCKSIEECREQLLSMGVPADRLPFLQFFHCRKTIPQVQQLALALAETAAILLDVESVRLYQDALFWKRAGDDGPTPWHTDARMAPFDTSQFVTLWIPLQPVPKMGSGLVFCSKTHSDFALPYWNTDSDTDDPKSQWNQLDDRYSGCSGYVDYYDKNKASSNKSGLYVDYMPLEAGDITAHSGWTLHCSDPCGPLETQDRLALAISYVDARAPVRIDAQQAVKRATAKNNQQKRKKEIQEAKADREDLWSYQDWVTKVPADSFSWDHPLVPIVWPPKSTDKKS